ncbi:6-hydroxymethylpterin diphosphokinase MptE-like protein [Salinigranum marinum]|uniref:6-hydroxymethylpterin diphosphokinase MptE-like protein n=1 Tax=Salinigranum marinum TaxID=1515595 RepID=UPI002989C0DA|nr:6-hydroxymethylpterin diphosphokinase MptE-like protein [Salinigranum marinum]
MNFAEWEPVYEQILAAFGFERAADERARDVLESLVSDRACFDTETLGGRVAGDTVAVVGAAPSLAAEVDRAAAADHVFAASTAADVCRDHGVVVDLMVTDLDKNPETAVALTRAGTPVAAHAHGDNVPAVREWLPQFDLGDTIPTTQAAPVPPVENFGGFTDGDRAAFLADHLGAGSLVFVGWEFDDPGVDAMKAEKLRWAARLLTWLEDRRDERYAVLDGHRDPL